MKTKLKTSSIAVYVLALMLVTVGYWNYISKESQTLQTVSVGNDTTSEEKKDENLGDAQLVSNNELMQEEEEQTSNEEDSIEGQKENENKNDGYFGESRLARDTMYSQTLETYKEMLNNSNVSEEQKARVTQEITKLNKEKYAIMLCENLISTKGFEDCVIFVNVDSISVIIKATELKSDEIAQIQNIISREMEDEIENIHIMTK